MSRYVAVTFDPHAIEQMEVRGRVEADAVWVLEEPDRVYEGKKKRLVAERFIVGRMSARVIFVEYLRNDTELCAHVITFYQIDSRRLGKRGNDGTS